MSVVRPVDAVVLPLRAVSRWMLATLRSARCGRTREPLVMTLAPDGPGSSGDERALTRRAREDRLPRRPLRAAARADDGGADGRAGCDEGAGTRRFGGGRQRLIAVRGFLDSDAPARRRARRRG